MQIARWPQAGASSGAQPSPSVPWWSFTKTLIAALALKLQNLRLVDLDAPVREGASLRQLLQHRAGIPDYGGMPAYHRLVAGRGAPWGLEEAFRRAGGCLLFPPGEGWAYSNIGTAMAVAALEESTGRTLADLFRQFFFEPAGCSASRVVQSPDDLASLRGVASGYQPGYVLHGLAAGPLPEAARILHGLLAGALLDERQRREALAMHRLGEALPGRPWATHGYGLGLMIGTDKTGRLFAGHTGGGPRSTIAVYMAIGASHAAAAFSETELEGAVEAAALREAAKD